MDEIKQTKDKLKKVANNWIELNELSKNAIYDINNPNANWNKKIEMPDIADFVDNKIVVEDTKPDKKNEEPPKKPKKKNNILSIVLFVLSPFMYIGSWILLAIADNCREYLDGQNSILFMLSRIVTIIGIILFIIGVILLNKVETVKKCKKIINQSNIESTPKEQKFIDKFSKKYVSILSKTFMCICPILLCACINIGSYGFNTILACLLSFLSIAVIGFGVVLIFKHKNKFLLDKLNFRVATKEIEENKKYNETEYPPLLEQYEEKVNIVRLEYLKQVNETHSKIAKLFEEIENIDIVSKSQARYAEQLLECIYKGAENMKEAFQMLEFGYIPNNKPEVVQELQQEHEHAELPKESYEKSNDYFSEYKTLTDEEKQPYINNAMRDWIELILKDPNLPRERKALLKYSIDNNEYHLEDLTDREKENVLMQAHLDYVHEHEDKDKQQPTQTQNCSISTPQITTKLNDIQKDDETQKQTNNEKSKPVRETNKKCQKYFYMDLKNANKQDLEKFDSCDKLCDEFFLLPKRLQKKYLIFDNLDGLPEEHKKRLTRTANHFVFENHIRDFSYKKSARYKMDILTQILVWFGIGSLAVSLLVGIIMSICTEIKEAFAAPIGVFFIEIGVIWIPWFLIEGFKFKWCAHCGTKLILTDITSENERIQSKRELYTGHTPWLVDNGHLSYDKNGTPFIDSIETVHDETQHFKCPVCGFVSQAKWKGVKK